MCGEAGHQESRCPVKGCLRCGQPGFSYQVTDRPRQTKTEKDTQTDRRRRTDRQIDSVSIRTGECVYH